MTIEQTVEIPADHKLILEIPEEVPEGRARVFIQFFNEEEQARTFGSGEIPPEARGQTSNEAFRSALRRAYGAWKDNPWTNYVEDINAMRDEWEHRDPWNHDPNKRHRD